MVVKPLDKYNRKFGIEPSHPLQKHHPDWDKRIKAHVQGLSPKDAKITVGIKKENKIDLSLDSKEDFKNRKLKIDIQDVKGIFDLNGNMMHQTNAEFFISNYVRYSDQMKEKMGTLGAMSKFKV